MIIFQNSKLTLFQSALYQTNTLLYDAGGFLLLVDPNWLPKEVQFIRDHVDEFHSGKSIYLLFTHSDYDHIIAYGLFPEAKVIASERFQNSLRKQKNLDEIHQFDQQHYLKRSYPILYPEVDFMISEDEQQLEIEGELLTFYLSPGHTDDGLFTIVESEGIFIAGDYLSDLEFPFIYFSSEFYIETLHKVDTILQNHIIQYLIPGHGHFIKDENSEILLRKNRDLKYVEDLRSAILNKDKFPIEDWLSQFPFPDGLKEQHEKNEKQVADDLN